MVRWYDDYLRWMYRGGRPNLFAQLQNRVSAIAMRTSADPIKPAPPVTSIFMPELFAAGPRNVTGTGDYLRWVSQS